MKSETKNPQRKGEAPTATLAAKTMTFLVLPVGGRPILHVHPPSMIDAQTEI
jgi:hypothetical protein